MKQQDFILYGITFVGMYMFVRSKQRKCRQHKNMQCEAENELYGRQEDCEKQAKEYCKTFGVSL